jgi:HSP20 family protein
LRAYEPFACLDSSEAETGTWILAQERIRKMNLLARWDPVRELDDFSNRLSGFFGRSPLLRRDVEDGLTGELWASLVDIAENEKEYLLQAELPGLEKNEVKVAVDEGMLVISGERKRENEEKNQKFHRIERSYGNFIRTFSLPDNADGTHIRAEFKNGILQVHLPKNKDAVPKTVKIKVE